MDKIVECVPNFSEGRNKAIIDAIADAIRSVPDVQLLDIDPGEATNRTVMTFVGTPDAVLEAAFQAIKKAAELIDMSKHKGAHPRMGATDVCPFVPVSGVTMDDCIELAHKLGKRVGEELKIPVYLYAEAATKPERRDLSKVREGEYEGLPDKLKDPNWQPDYGPAEFNPKTGATIIGAREFLIAYNINLNTRDRKLAHKVAKIIRETGYNVKRPDGTKEHVPGKLKAVRAIGWYIEEYGCAQISINLLNYKVTPLHVVFETAKEEAEKLGLRVTGSEIVGLVPKDALLMTGRYYLQKQGKSTAVPEPEIIHTAILSLGLNDVTQFIPEEKIIEYKIAKPLRFGSMSMEQFLNTLSLDTPTPGGGSVAAISGALGASLIAMVGNLTFGKKDYEAVWQAAEKLANTAQQLKMEFLTSADRDADAFDAVMKAMRLARKGEPEALQQAVMLAIDVPLSVMKNGIRLLEIACEMAKIGNRNALSDVAVATEMAMTAVKAGKENVEINLPMVDDDDTKDKIKHEADKLLQEANKLYSKTIKEITKRKHENEG